MSVSENARITIVIPKKLLERVDRYCEKVMGSAPKIRSAVIRQAIERFLNEQEKREKG